MEWKKSVLGPPGRELEYVDRQAWGAKNPPFFKFLHYPVAYLVQVVTDTHTCRFDADCIRTVRKLQEEHMKEEGVPDIKYNFLVGGDARVYEGRGWNTQVIHTNPEQASKDWQDHDWNGKSLIFAYIGPYGVLPSQKVQFVMRDLIGEAIKQKYLKVDFLRIPGFFEKKE